METANQSIYRIRCELDHHHAREAYKASVVTLDTARERYLEAGSPKTSRALYRAWDAHTKATQRFNNASRALRALETL